MSHTVHVDATRRYDLDAPDGTTAGAWADTIAADHGVLGTEFSFKADGDVLDRRAKLDKLDDGTLLELIEVTVPVDAVEPAPETDHEPVPGALIPPDGPRDDVIAWVAEGRDGWRQRAQAALDHEPTRDGGPRATLEAHLTRILATE